MTTGTFSIHVFYPDGDLPETGEQPLDGLSARWRSICADALDRNGPVMDHNMGSTLSHFDIKMRGPVGQLCAFEQVCFEFAITSGLETEQDRATKTHFEELLARVTGLTGAAVRRKYTMLRDALRRPTLLMFDACPTGVDDDQKGVLMQLGFHLAGAYYEYCEPVRQDLAGH